jgi:sugar/nucleoside kinase (ribokinase family)
VKKILCIGSASVDIKAFSQQEDVQNAYREGSIDLVPGGVARCMAINLKRLGFDASLYSALGNDIFGEYIRSGLREAGVTVDLLRTSPSRKTALFSVMGAQGGNVSCVYSNEVLREIVPDAAFYAFVKARGIDAFALDSNLSPEMLSAVYGLKETTLADSPTARSANAPFIFQNATSPDIARKSLPWAKLVDLFAANEFEAAAILGARPSADDATADRFRELGFRNFIVTFGSEGVLVAIGDRTWFEKPYKPTAVVDTIGAGDAFASGFLYGFLSGKPEKTCIGFGLACARETIATRDTVSDVLSPAFLDNYRYP